MKKTLFLILFVCSYIIVYNQNYHTDKHPDVTERCSMDAYDNLMRSEDPDYDIKRAAIEKELQYWIENNQEEIINNKTIITIPVVVHILYYIDNPAYNLPESRVLEQIQMLNDDYRRLNADAANTPSVFNSVAADCQIEFCLAKRTPNNVYTNGIVRVKTTVSQFAFGNAMKYTAQGGSNAWDRNKYLNLWVCNLGGGLLGFSQFPGGPAATDGVVIHYRYFGKTGASAPYNKGRTATHEIGHWLNLYHIWGDDASGSCTGSDYCNDTPNQTDEYYGCPTFPQNTCSSDDMFMNYMDYTDDGCMNIFTINQRSRMLATLNGQRASLKTSDGCVPGTGIFDNDILASNLMVYPNPAQNYLNIELSLPDVQDVCISLINNLGQLIYKKNLKNTLNITENINIEELQNGIYLIKIDGQNFSLHRKICVL